MHDSRGAELKKGDRVLIEAEITSLSTGGDENYCCVDVKVVTPDQPNKDKVMSPPSFGALSTRMLTKIGAAVLLLALLAGPLFAQDPVDRLTAMENNLNAMMANVSRIKSDVSDIKSRLDNIEQKMDALVAKPQAASTPSATKQVWQPATAAWGPNAIGRFVTVSADTPDPIQIAAPIPVMTTTSWGSSAMSSGACANGSCSSGAGSMRGIGVFRLRR